MIDEFKEKFLENIKHYSQEEGLKDHEIAELLGCSRATVNRHRQEHAIPTANLHNRKDKLCTCESCGKTYYIRRKERRKKVCENCNE